MFEFYKKVANMDVEMVTEGQTFFKFKYKNHLFEYGGLTDTLFLFVPNDEQRVIFLNIDTIRQPTFIERLMFTDGAAFWYSIKPLDFFKLKL